MERSQPEAQKTKADSPQASAKEKAQDKTESKKDQEKAQPNRRSPRQPSGPFVDRQLDKALEVLRSQLAEKAKAA